MLPAGVTNASGLLASNALSYVAGDAVLRLQNGIVVIFDDLRPADLAARDFLL